MKRLPKRRAKPSKFQFSFPQTPKLPKSWQKYPLFYSLWLIFELFFTKDDKNNPDFWQKWQKKPFFRARGARGGGPPRHPPNRPAKIYRQNPRQNTTAKLNPHPFLEFHFPSYTLHFWNSTIYRSPPYRSPPIMEFHYLHIASTYGIPLPIIHPPLLEFHYLYIASNYGIPTIVLTTITASNIIYL